MSVDYRHHVARPVIVFVGGSPEPLRQAKPRPYPRQDREQWRPKRAIPPNRKAEGLKRQLDSFRRQDEIISAIMTPNVALWSAWLHRCNVPENRQGFGGKTALAILPAG